MAARVGKRSEEMSTRLRYIENRTRELEKLLADNKFDDGPSDSDDRDDHGGDSAAASDVRTERLIKYGRPVPKRRFFRPRNIAIGALAGCAVIIIAALTLFSGGPSWPASVTAVKAEILTACQNPDVVSEPSQVDFACAKSTQQVLWVLALLTSDDDSQYNSSSTGREGLEPIAPAQGGSVAWSLNLHQPYNPYNAIDSLEVAARAINNIVGGATVTGSDGKTQVEPGLESDPSNCARYTGSAAVVSHAGYPSICALPVSTAAGQAALVADVYRQWVVGSSAVAAQDASVLFENATNPGNAQVQAILTDRPASGL